MHNRKEELKTSIQENLTPLKLSQTPFFTNNLNPLFRISNISFILITKSLALNTTRIKHHFYTSIIISRSEHFFFTLSLISIEETTNVCLRLAAEMRYTHNKILQHSNSQWKHPKLMFTRRGSTCNYP